VTVQRVFIVDSHSIATAVETVSKTAPDMIELMPGIATKAISFFRQRVKTPIIAGGLIETLDEALEAQRAGADAVSTGNTFLWK
jgi:glycerol uptake operon antiterminator